MSIRDITFPVTVEDFTAYQEMIADRELTHSEREIVAAWLPVYNDAYDAGVAGDTAALAKMVGRMDGLISGQLDNVAATRFLRGSRAWIVAAWDWGHGSRMQN